MSSALLLWLAIGGTQAVEDSPVNIQPVTMDVYIRPDSDRCRELQKYVGQLQESRPGLRVVVHDVVEDLDARRELYELGSRYRVGKLGLPAIHVMDRFHVGYSDSEASQKRVRDLLTIEVFTRDGCPRCRDAKSFLADLEPEWPALRFQIYEIVRDHDARDRMHQLARQYGVMATSVPAFHLCGQLKIGYLGPSISGRQIEEMIRKAARAEDSRSVEDARDATPEADSGGTTLGEHFSGELGREPLLNLVAALLQIPRDASRMAITGLLQSQESGTIDRMDDLPELPDDMDPLPEPDGIVVPSPNDAQRGTDEATDEMEVPVLGRLSVDRLGMPLFTFLVGLVDGFNPCAMWVLLFLLSVLVNIKDRRKILVIAGTFVIVSGLAYFAFMAAWLNVFMLIGLDRYAQIALGCFAIVIGTINVKDFFAFGRGVSMSIPDSAKPGLYARVRKIVMAPHLWAALSGAIVLAVLVNIIELLCTAGLPALYTQILVMQEYSSFVNYLYLGLYIVAYMLDDTLLVGIVVLTLSKRKLQETQGRWLKLLSGVVILALGILMLVKPEALV